MNKYLTFLDSLKKLLGTVPSRKTLMKIPKLDVTHKYKIRVERTSPFEFINPLMSPYLGLWGAEIKTEYSEYDTTLSNLLIIENIDAYLIWLDWRLYKNSMTPKAASNWLKKRIQTIRSKSTKPILFNNWFEMGTNGEMLFSPSIGERGWTRELNVQLSHLNENITGCEMIDLAGLTSEVHGSFYDYRNDKISQFPFSDQAAISIARHLGVHLFPALFKPRIKAIVLDLDDTLYQGVLGEDGADGVVCSEGHIQLQNLLLKLKTSGILLAICSRNEREDVKALFHHKGDDFPLKWSDFAVVCANWRPKPKNIQTIAEELNISPSDFLFVDDNPTELLKAAASFPEIRLLQADNKNQDTVQLLSHYPGLYQFHTDESGGLRTTDIQANQVRNEMKTNASDYNTYLTDLQMVIHIYHNHHHHSKRLYELSHKTNQFNLTLKRMNATEAEEVLTQSNYLAFTVKLTDCLSDSGVIGGFIYQVSEIKANLIEMVFSCRALGREIETVAFAYTLNQLIQQGVEKLHISSVKGPRNKPALDWIERFTNASSVDPSLNELYERVKSSCSHHPAKVEVIK